MSDLKTKLRQMAKIQTATSEFAPDEHIAWQAADEIAELEAKLAEKDTRIGILETARDIYKEDAEKAEAQLELIKATRQVRGLGLVSGVAILENDDE